MALIQFDDYDPVEILSTPGVSTHLSRTPIDEMLLTDFFGGVAAVEVPEPQGSTPAIVPTQDGWEAIQVADEPAAPKSLRPVHALPCGLGDEAPTPLLSYLLGTAVLLCGSAWAYLQC